MLYTVIPIKEARALRRAFVKRFADKTLPQYRSTMGHGEFYGSNGRATHLWETYHHKNIISRSVAIKLINSAQNVVAAWDVPIKNTPRSLQKSRAIKLNGHDLAVYIQSGHRKNSELSFLPQDIYIFDENLDFHVTFTHQHLQGFGNICFTSMTNVKDNGVSPAFRELFELALSDRE